MPLVLSPALFYLWFFFFFFFTIDDVYHLYMDSYVSMVYSSFGKNALTRMWSSSCVRKCRVIPSITGETRRYCFIYRFTECNVVGIPFTLYNIGVATLCTTIEIIHFSIHLAFLTHLQFCTFYSCKYLNQKFSARSDPPVLTFVLTLCASNAKIHLQYFCPEIFVMRLLLAARARVAQPKSMTKNYFSSQKWRLSFG